MIPQAQSFPCNLPLPSVPLPTSYLPQISVPLPKPLSKARFIPRTNASPTSVLKPPRCSVSAVSEPAHVKLAWDVKPSPSEVSRTIVELSSAGTLSLLSPETWPLGVGVRFAVDAEGTPVVCLKASYGKFSVDKRASLHVQFEQCGFRTPQCTIQGSFDKPVDGIALKKLQSLWQKRFGEEVDWNLIHVLAVERVLLIEDFMEDGIWVTSSDYRLASPDPLRNFAEQFVTEINMHNTQDVNRFCNIYVDSDIQVLEAKMVWVDRLGFDMRLSCPRNSVFEVRIPFPREVTDEKGAKSSFNCMSQLAWEVERNYRVPDFEKVNQLKKVDYRRQ